MSETIENVQPEPASPPPEVTVPAGDDVAPSEPLSLSEIEQIRDSDIDRYWAQGLDAQWRELKDSEPTFTLDDLEVIDASTDAADADAGEDAGEADGEDGDAGEEVEEEYQHVDDAVPESASDYQLPEVEGHDWGEGEKENLAPFLETFHELELPRSAANRLLEVYGEQVAALNARDESDVKNAREVLVSELGGQENYKATITKVAAFVESLGDLGVKIAESRAPDGTRLVNDVSYVKLLSQLSEQSRGQPTGARSEPMDNYSPSEEDQLVSLMNSDVGTFMAAPWRNTGVTASERLLQLRRGATKR